LRPAFAAVYHRALDQTIDEVTPPSGRMKTLIKLLSVIAISIIALLLVSCSRVPPPPRPVSQNPDVLNAEAQAGYRKQFDRIFTDCGGFHYTQLHEEYRSKKPGGPQHNGIFIYRIKGVNFKFNPQTLTEADKQNGFEWKGAVGFIYDTARVYEQGKGWGKWLPRVGYSTYNLSWGSIANKKNSVWTFQPFDLKEDTEDYYQLIEFKKITCNEIPQ